MKIIPTRWAVKMTRPKRPLKLVLSVIVQLVIFITVLLAFERWLLSTNEKPRLSAAQLAPITAQLSPDEFSRFASGEPLLVYVWATWCSICSVSSANVSDYGADHLSATVAVQSGTDLEIRQFIQDRGYQFQAYNDRAGHWFNSVGASVTPTYLWISLSGEILHLSRGYTSSVGLTGRRLILADQNTD